MLGDSALAMRTPSLCGDPDLGPNAHSESVDRRCLDQKVGLAMGTEFQGFE